MNKVVVTLAMVLSLLLPGLAKAADPVVIDVLFMDHGPLRPTLNTIKDLFANYGDKISVRWHDFESREGEDFMAKMGVTRHVPLVIWINGKETMDIDGASCTFSGFPSGAGPAMFQGKWTLELLTKALDVVTKQN
jgi:hypothetical protein